MTTGLELSARKPLFIRIHQAFEFIAGIAVLLLVFAITNTSRMPDGIQQFLALRLTVKNFVTLLAFIFCWTALLEAFGLYLIEQYRSLPKGIIRFACACAVATFFAMVFCLTSDTGAFQTTTALLFGTCLALVGITVRIGLYLSTFYFPSVSMWRRNILIVGTGPSAVELSEQMEESSKGGDHVMGFVDDHVCASAPGFVAGRVLGTLGDLEQLLVRHVVDRVVVALPMRTRYDQIQSAIEICERVGVQVAYRCDLFKVSIATHHFSHQGQFPVVSLKSVKNSPNDLFAKRCVDLVGATAGLICLSPVMLAAAIAVRLSGKGPILFKQQRYGLNKRLFGMYKFRTMVVNAEALQPALESQNEVQGPAFKMRADPRITRIGRVLRKTSIDELPQLINVLIGHMSIVGPRPLPLRDVSRFNNSRLMRRFSVKPGLTCLWQVSGRSNTNFDQWIAQDLKYIDSWSLFLDFKIIAMTFPAVVKGSGAV